MSTQELPVEELKDTPPAAEQESNNTETERKPKKKTKDANASKPAGASKVTYRVKGEATPDGEN